MVIICTIQIFENFLGSMQEDIRAIDDYLESDKLTINTNKINSIIFNKYNTKTDNHKTQQLQ